MKNNYGLLASQPWLVYVWLLCFALPASVFSQSTLTLLPPSYNCTTGAITFNKSGGDGSPIVYSASGITRSSSSDSVGVVEQNLRNDPKPILIQATQRGYTASYTFDLKAFCSAPPTGDPLKLIAPTFSCYSVGAVAKFNITGGDGSPITYSLSDLALTSPTSNTVNIQCIDPEKAVTIQAMQSGYTTNYSFVLKDVCRFTYIGKPMTINTIPDLTLSPGQTLNAYDISKYFQDPNFAYINRYERSVIYSFSAQGLPEGMTYSTEGTSQGGVTWGLVAKFRGKAPAKAGVYPVTITASNGYCGPVSATFNLIVSDQTNTTGLAILPPFYNCQSGLIQFYTNGGDGSPITYTVPGVTRTDVTSTVGIVEQELRNDPKPIIIQATQSGYTVRYTFDFAAFCNNVQPPTGNTLALAKPTYDCATGAITFNTTGGDGSPIEFKAIGITDWSTNPNQFVDRESRTVSDVQPFTLMARQNGQTVTYIWDLKAACGRARVGVSAAEFAEAFSLQVLGNPAHEQVGVQIRGAQGQPVQLRLMDLQGRLLESRTIEQPGTVEEQHFLLTNVKPGLLLLQAGTAQQTQTVKVIKE